VDGWRLRLCFFFILHSLQPRFDPHVASLGFEPCLIAAPPVCGDFFSLFLAYTHNALSNAATAAYMEIGDAPLEAPSALGIKALFCASF